MRIVGIAGAFRPGAHVRRLLDAVARQLPESAEFEIWDGLERVPPVGNGRLPAEVDELCRVLSAADGLLITAPEHSVLPVQLKHALSWAASPMAGGVLVGKPVAVVTACVRPHEAMWTQVELHWLLGAGGAVVHRADLPVFPAARQFNVIGRLADPVARERAGSALEAVCADVREALKTRAACRFSGLAPLAAPAPIPVDELGTRPAADPGGRPRRAPARARRSGGAELSPQRS
ncbi:NAD(P)H-dependent oxidoreductase [Planomonospora sp. ID67723]|uniref:NADPH-dependent FMN reductase n=1 Tax=Planomonospora sp. ID67723 TaxID=2738134 RepID=UPI0018C3EAB9|nr:NAD(P)H-dependent oxidoreductase [Planomonospora sp. ID67723]MBG0830260.1 NAD(P)H-dependent oxidoreductase [Planomonospora sp. ID67723]